MLHIDQEVLKMNQVFFRKACESDVTALRVIARNSEAVWDLVKFFCRYLMIATM